MPIDMMKNTSAAILAHYAEMDMNVNATREQLEMVLLAAGKTFQKSIHPGTRHAFNNDTGANYNEGAAVAAWEETLAWFNAPDYLIDRTGPEPEADGQIGAVGKRVQLQPIAEDDRPSTA